MKKGLLSISLLSTLVITGCTTTSGGDGGLLDAINQFTNILEGTKPFIQESKDWEKYSIEKTTQGVVYSPANKSDKEFVAKKLDKEYGPAVDRLSRPFAYNEELKKGLDEENNDYRFTYNQVMSVKDQKTAKTLGYCVNFDVNYWENGKPTAWNKDGNQQKAFIYVATDRPVSVTTVDRDFIKRMCGNDFYTQYKNPKD